MLNDKPYFNEPGNKNSANTAPGEKYSLAYNQTAFLLSCRTMMYSLRKPPKVTTEPPSLVKLKVVISQVSVLEKIVIEEFQLSGLYQCFYSHPDKVNCSLCLYAFKY